MRKLTPEEITERQQAIIGLCETKMQQVADRQELRNQVKVKNHQIKETERDIDSLTVEVMSGETAEEQMELPR